MSNSHQNSPDFSGLYQALASAGKSRPSLHTWLAHLPAQLDLALSPQRFPEFARWWSLISKLPQLQTAVIDLNSAAVSASQGRLADGSSLSAGHLELIEKLLLELKPWRKGPFNLHGIYIDTEWRSDFKWQRLEPHLASLNGRRVLDVGGGSGYHAWRIAGAGAALSLCIDPSPRFFAQFMAVQKLLAASEQQVFHLPLALEDLPARLEAFNTVLSMGVLYHRRAPLEHLLELKDCLLPGGELVLETLVVPGDLQTCLMPKERYAAMNNVWFLPSVAQLELWLERTGFSEIRCVDLNQTSTAEQRATPWMEFQSLQDFLDPANPQLTREGYPAPLRAIFLARKPS